MLLKRSGIGQRERLETLGVRCLVDLPGVGEGYQDHEVGQLGLRSENR